MNCLLLRYVAKNVNCNIVAKSIYFFSLSNWIFFTHNVFMFDFFFYFKAWKIDWEFVGTCFLDSLSHRKFFFIFRLSANCQGARIWLWEVWMCSIQWIWSGIFLCCHALCQRCVSPSVHWKILSLSLSNQWVIYLGKIPTASKKCHYKLYVFQCGS